MTQPALGANGHVYIVSAARTPIGKFGGALAAVPAVELGGVAIRAAVERAALPEGTPIDEVLMGQVLQAGGGPAPPRQAPPRAGPPGTTRATPNNPVCGAGRREARARETMGKREGGPGRDPSLEGRARLRPTSALPGGADGGSAKGGTGTAGNAPGITDGAAATLVASERAVERLGLKPLARIVGYAQAEVAPKWLFLAPVEGVRRLLDRIELPIEAFDLIEINEAFAAQTLADGRELGFDWDKVNVNGGAIALGHPIGASGARIVATLLHELDRRGGRYGLATLCLGGGGSVAAAFERVAP